MVVTYLYEAAGQFCKHRAFVVFRNFRTDAQHTQTEAHLFEH